MIQIMFAGSFTFVRENIFLLPAITLFSLLQVLVASTTMLALSSMSKSSRFVGVMYAGLIFFTSALFNALARHHRTQLVCLDLADRDARADRQHHLPARSAVHECRPFAAVLALAVADCRLAVDPRAQGARRRGGPVIGETHGATQRAGPRLDGRPFAAPSQAAVAAAASAQTIVQATQLSKWYGQVSGLNDVTASIPGGITGSARTQRRRQVDLHEADDRSAQAEQGRRSRSSASRCGATRHLPPHRVLSRAGRVLRPDDRARVGDRAGAAERRHRQRRGRGREARARARSISSTPPARRSAPTARACASASSWRRRWSTIPNC